MKINHFVTLTFGLVSLFACQDYDNTNSDIAPTPPPITPDYKGVTIPANIAPLNFRVDNANKVRADIKIDGDIIMSVRGKKGLIEFNTRKWSELLQDNAGKKINIEVTKWANSDKNGIIYSPFDIYISPDSIDCWISYRLMEPGYEGWSRMGIYQRDLSSFKETVVLDNTVNNYGCINCHSYANNNAECMLFHSRSNGGGTVFYKNKELIKVDFSKIGPNKQVTYPQWCPAGRYVAFSSNATFQTPYAGGNQPVEVYDTDSDLVLYDTQEGKVITDSRFLAKEFWETYPSWSPDGKWLYFCSAKKVEIMPKQRADVHYDLLRVEFDAKNGILKEKVDTIYNSRVGQGSVSYPRVSSDGKYLMFTSSNYGTFPVWHNEADLKTIDLRSGQEIDCTILNSEYSESYHAWSSSSRWVIFASRRLDGRYTRLFIAHCSEDGQFSKPFLLPQKDPNHNLWRLKSYNIAEFTTTEIKLPIPKIKELLHGSGDDHRWEGVN